MVESKRVGPFQISLAAMVVLGLAGLSVHCAAIDGSTEDEETAKGNGKSSHGASGDDTLDIPDAEAHDANDFYADDPPPTGCNGGGQPPAPGGTPECPDDKNLQGCPCPEQGAQAPCWPGMRKNRNRGVCHDGTATCELVGENSLSWGECKGYQLPTGTTGKEACVCFSGGQWALNNVVPCSGQNQNGTWIAVSTTMVGGQIQCDSIDAAPSQAWSPNRLRVDCTGQFKLCYALKAGNARNPLPSDCELVKVCTESHYAPANSWVDFPPLPAWITDASKSSCVDQFYNGAGYGEMSVVGETDECEKIDKVFNRLSYCPASCNEPNPPPECAECGNDGGGNF